VLPLLGGAAAGLAGTLAWGARSRSSQFFGPSVWHGDRNRRTLALTFDDGPSESTPELLAVLERLKVPATFFCCGVHVRRLPEIARAIAAEGHEIGNHSNSHARLWLRSPAFISQELERAQAAITEATGKAPKLFRAPYGVRWFGLAAAQARLGLLGVMWSIIGRDWVLDGPQVANRISRAANGDIICLHDARELAPNPDIRGTIEAVRLAVPVLREQGFRFETVSEICQTK
jgi:peptidoglycan-N-acetylglucosamine deacetylase